MSTDELITVTEAAQVAGVSTVTVYKRIDRGKLAKTVKFGLILVSRAACEEWRREREGRAALSR